MRPIETILSAANFLAFFSLVLPLPLHLRWIRYTSLLAPLLALVQITVEGPRWQMVPAYALAIIFFLVWLLSIVPSDNLHVHRFLLGTGVGLGVLMLIIATALPVLLPVFHFPKPTGPYAIGTLTYHWVDASRPELFTPDPNDHREVIAQIWYPARDEPSAARAPYIQDARYVTPALAFVTGLPGFVFSYFKYATTNVVASAPIADDTANYPVLIYLTGVEGFRSVSMFQIQELVSHGYIVVGLDQPGVVAMAHLPDGREIGRLRKEKLDPLIDQSVEAQPQTPRLYGKPLPDGIIPYFGQDVPFVLDQLASVNVSDPNHILTGRLDLWHAGTFGVSLGGMNAAEACHQDSRLKACLIMDVYIPADVVKSGLQQPAMFITRDANTMRLERKYSPGWTEAVIASTLGTMRTVYQNLPGEGYFVTIPGMFHNNFTDLPYWSPLMSQLGQAGPIDRQRGFDIVNAYTVAFFDKELKDRPSSLLDGSVQPYPEVIFEKRR